MPDPILRGVRHLRWQDWLDVILFLAWILVVAYLGGTF